MGVYSLIPSTTFWEDHFKWHLGIVTVTIGMASLVCIFHWSSFSYAAQLFQFIWDYYVLIGLWSLLYNILAKRVKEEVKLLSSVGTRRFSGMLWFLFLFPCSPWYRTKDSLVHCKGMMLECDYCACLLLLSTSLYCFPSLVIDMFSSVSNFCSLAQGRISSGAL